MFLDSPAIRRMYPNRLQGKGPPAEERQSGLYGRKVIKENVSEGMCILEACGLAAFFSSACRNPVFNSMCARGTDAHSRLVSTRP